MYSAMKTNISVRTLYDGMAKFRAEIEEFKKKELLVGIPAAEGNRDDTSVSNAAIGYIQETGSPANNIPARPFLRPGVKKVEKRLIAELRKGAINVLNGRLEALNTAYMRSGTIAQNSVKATIRAGEGFAPLAPTTLAARKRAGAKGTKPLIRTGQLLNSVTYVVRPKDKGK
jgi:hypothetical protein